MLSVNSHLISIAPMMDWTDRHDRYFLRLISPSVRLYTEMVTAQALAYGDVNHLLGFDKAEKPLALQLGGSDPVLLAQAAKIGEDFGYDEINLNAGCPSKRVQSGRFGACLMLEPLLVADCLSAMQQVVKVTVTIKCRIGVDEQDSYQDLYNFIEIISKTPCQIVILHARKAWLSGLSPKQNREVPPLNYEVVKQIKQDFPHLTIVINGGIKTIADIDRCLDFVDGVMIGREAYANPYFLASIQEKYFSSENVRSRHEVIQAFLPYVQEQLQNNKRLTSLTRHILGLFQGKPGAAVWRRYLSQEAPKKGAGIEVIEQALRTIS